MVAAVSNAGLEPSSPLELPSAMKIEEQVARELADWSLANARFSAFSSTSAAFDATYFEELFGFPPETQTTRKAQFLSEFSTTREQTVYQLVVAGPKIDVIISAGLQVGEVPKAFPVLQEAVQVRVELRRVAASLIGRVPEVRRLAVGEQTLMPAASRIEAYKALARFLPSIKIDAENSSDFFYRINRPRIVDFNGQKRVINRLSQWGCLQLNVTVTASEVSKTVVSGEAVSLITDVNSTAEDDLSALTSEEKVKITDKLFAFSAELSEKGDHP